MKNYYDQQMELDTVKFRIATLKEKKAMYFTKTQPSSPKFSEKVNSSHVNNEPFLEYASKIEEIDKELEELYKEAEILENYLGKMSSSLKTMRGTLEKIFVARYVDGLSVKRIAEKFCYSESHIYLLLHKIKNIIKGE